MKIDIAREKNLSFLNAHLGNAPIERLLDSQAARTLAGVVIVSREVTYTPNVDIEDPWLDDGAEQQLTAYEIDVVKDGYPLVSVSALLPAPDEDNMLRTNVFELLLNNEDELEALKMCLDDERPSVSRPRPH